MTVAHTEEHGSRSYKIVLGGFVVVLKIVCAKVSVFGSDIGELSITKPIGSDGPRSAHFGAVSERTFWFYFSSSRFQNEGVFFRPVQIADRVSQNRCLWRRLVDANDGARWLAGGRAFVDMRRSI